MLGYPSFISSIKNLEHFLNFNFMIHDVKINPLKILSDERGKVMHMLRKDSVVFQKFGEIYFSTIFKNAVKA